MTAAAPKKRFAKRLIASLALLLPGLSTPLPADDSLQPEDFRPAWEVGLQWVVESAPLQTAARRDAGQSAPKPTRWEFTVKQAQQLDQRECYLVQVTCLDAGAQPLTILWVDRDTMTLRRIETQLPGPEGLRHVEETYHSSNGQPFPVFAPLTVPPLELPLLMSGAKSDQTFTYDVTSGPRETKGLGELGFRFGVAQRLAKADLNRIGHLLPEDYSKDVRAKPAMEVRLEMSPAKAYQIWQTDAPWPVYSDNGVAKSRLVEIRRPARATP